MGIVLALCVGVPLTIFSIYYFADNVTSLATLVIVVLAFLALAFGTIIIYRKRIFKKLFGTTKVSIEEITSIAMSSIQEFASGNVENGLSNSKETTKIIASYYSWIQFRKWMINVMIGLIVGFGTLIGSALLHKQNSLIETQNFRLFTANQKTFEFIDYQSQMFLRERKVATAEIFFDTLRPALLRSDAFTEYIILRRLEENTFEEVLVQSLKNTLDGLYLNDIEVVKLDLHGFEFVNCQFEGSNFSNCDFSGSTFEKCNFKNSRISYSNLENTFFNNCILDTSTISNCEMQGIIFSNSNLSHFRIFTNENSNFDWRYFWEIGMPEGNKGKYEIYPDEIMDSIFTVQQALRSMLGDSDYAPMGLQDGDWFFGNDGRITNGKYPFLNYNSRKDSIW